QELDVIDTYPVEIIPGFLCVATFLQSQAVRVIKDLKVKANVIVGKQNDTIFAADGMTLGKDEKRVKQIVTIPIDDNGEEDLYSHLSDIIHFIDGRTVLLSSTLGISRSVAVVVAYYMWNKKVSRKGAYKHVKKCRENMQPTRGFIEQLSRWEEKMFGSIVTDISDPEY
ncbi:serine/threonine/tyrosine-interacting-like protein 1, partial [Orbicella faveolata]|uniref:serine/threonine/tyrosine-interacting-like protein 1 n=1 Tax=Orbicella faveolata TaxID=48498 RepID=UPI0009E3FD62